MRRDGGGTLSVANVKIERTSTEKPKSATPDPEPEPSVRPVRIKKEKVDEPIVDKSAAESDSNKKTSNDVVNWKTFFEDLIWNEFLQFENYNF